MKTILQVPNYTQNTLVLLHLKMYSSNLTQFKKMSISLKKFHTLSLRPGMGAREKEVTIKGLGEWEGWKETQEGIARNVEQDALKDSIFFSFWSCSIFVVWNFSRGEGHGWDLLAGHRWSDLLLWVVFVGPVCILTQLFLWSLVIIEHKWESYRKGQKMSLRGKY